MKPNQQPKIIKNKKRVGRGRGSSRGNFSGRGTKGQRSRAGYNIPVGFEGGQTPIKKRIPKLGGFKRQVKRAFEIVNLSQLDKSYQSNQLVDPKSLARKGLIRSSFSRVKILADGQLNKKLMFKNCHFSKNAQFKIKSKANKRVKK